MTIESVSETVSDLAADILTGAEAIGKEIGENRRKTFYLLLKRDREADEQIHAP